MAEVYVERSRAEDLSLGDILYLHDVDGKRIAGIEVESIKSRKAYQNDATVKVTGSSLDTEELEELEQDGDQQKLIKGED